MRKYVGKKKVILLTLACTAALTANGFAAAPAAETQEFSLDTMVVTASRSETKKVDTPANITVITSEKLEEGNYADASEALRDVPGVNILGSGAKGTNMGQEVILLNGDSRVLVLIDGRRVNIASSGNYSADWLPPIDTIERIEVLKGAGSALYGTDAVGGVINVILKKGSVMPEQVKVKAATGSWNTEQYGIVASGSRDGLGILINAGKDRRGNYSYKDGKSGDVKKLQNSGYDTTSASIKLDKEIGENNLLTFQFEHLLDEGGNPFGFLGFVPADRHERLSNNVAMRYDWNQHEDNSGFAQVYKNYHHASFISPDPGNVSDFNEDKYGVEIQQNWRLNDKNSLTGGFDYYKSDVENQAMYGGTRKVNNKALYLENRWQIDSSWQLNAGARYDDHSNYGSEFTPHISLNKKINEESNAYVSWGKIFNAPTTDALYWYQPAYGMYGNPNLKPETGSTLTIGANTKLSDRTSLTANVFRSSLDDAIDWAYYPDTSETQAVNVNSEKRQGLELSIGHKFDENWSAEASYTYLQIKQDFGSGYEKNRSAKPNIYRAGVKYKNNDLVVNLTMQASTGQAPSYMGKWGETPAYGDKSYFTMNLGAQYQVSKDMKVFAQLNNLNNAAYQEYSGLYDDGTVKYPMPSRHLVVGMEYTF